MFIGEGVAPQARSGSALCAIAALPLASAAVFRNWRLVVIPGISIMQERRRYYGSKRLSLVKLDSESVDSTARARRTMSGGWANGSVTQFARQAKHFVQRGMVAIVADYRVLGHHRGRWFPPRVRALRRSP